MEKAEAPAAIWNITTNVNKIKVKLHNCSRTYSKMIEFSR